MVNEFTWNGSSYDESIINVPASSLVLARIGPGRNDGVNRLYVNGFFSHLYEITYNAGNWEAVDMMPTGEDRSRYSARVVRARGDGQYRIYVSTQGGPPVMEFEWVGSGYLATPIDALTGATAAALTAGDGRNDGSTRLYVADNDNGKVYEISWVWNR